MQTPLYVWIHMAVAVMIGIGVIYCIIKDFNKS